MKAKVLMLLKQTDGYLSGQEISEKLHVSRTAVWKVIGCLKEEGYKIEAVRNKGYRLAEVADVITEAELSSRIHGKFAGMCLEYHDELDSTNNRAKAMAEEGCPHGTLVVADCQTRGKGRRGRMWSSPQGVAVYMSMVLRPNVAPSCASMVTLVAAMAVSDGIEKAVGVKTVIKWPNDVVAGGKKVCGILTEMSAELDCIYYVVVGIGINANMEEFPEEIEKTATSLRLESGKPVSRAAVIAAVMASFENYYAQYEKTGDMSGLIEEYNEKLASRGSQVKVLCPSGDYTGVSLGVDSAGRLLVSLPDKTVRRVVSGEVSVRGIYGYV